jgi:hexosaminidase
MVFQLEDEETVSALRENEWTLDDALNDFTAKTHEVLLGRSKTPVVWQEMVRSDYVLFN